MRIIQRYTREAGLRQLERVIGRVVRKVAVRFAQGETGVVTVSARRSGGDARAGAFPPGEGAPGDDPGSRRGPCLDGGRGRGALRRGDASSWRERPHSHRTARKRDAGVGPRRPELPLGEREAARDRARDASASKAFTFTFPRAPFPRTAPRPGITMATALASLYCGQARAIRHRDDRRDHSQGTGAPDRRGEGEGAGRASGGVHAA